MLVYFMRPVGLMGPVKIGLSRDPHFRLKNISVASPFKLEVAAMAPGTALDERALHIRFKPHSMNGEWFAENDELTDLIKTVSETGMLPGASAASPASQPREYPSESVGALKEWRQRNNKSLYVLAKDTGTTAANLWRIERGQQPSVELAKRLEVATGIPAAVFVMGDAA